MCDTNLCPLLAAYDVAESMLDELGNLHEHPVLARGAIAANRRTHEVVRERYPCGGAVSDNNNELTCPLGLLRNTAHAFATNPNQRQGWAFDPEKLVDGGTASQSGQYL